MDIVSTKEAAASIGITGRELGAFVKRYPQFAPERREGFPPFYTSGLVKRIVVFREGVANGTICPTCGNSLGTVVTAIVNESGATDGGE